MFFGVAEDVVVEEGHHGAKCGEGQQGVCLVAGLDVNHAVEGAGHRRQARGKAVDAVDEVQRVGDEYRKVKARHNISNKYVSFKKFAENLK